MNKDVLVALIAKDVKELNILTEGLEQMEQIPSQYLQLAYVKSQSLTENIGLLFNNGVCEVSEMIQSPTNDLMHRAAKELESQCAAVASLNEEKLETERIEAERKAEIERQTEEALHQAEAARIDTVISQAHVTTVADAIKSQESLIDKLSQKEDNSIASTLGMKKIDDLKQSITIVDRFRFQRELFLGDGEKMNRAIADFNAMASMREAEEYISKKFSTWSTDSDTVADFLHLLQRRYL